MDHLRTIIAILLAMVPSVIAQPFFEGELGWRLNTPPRAETAILTMRGNTTATNFVVGYDREGPVSYALVTAPTNGTLTLASTTTGEYRYTPTVNYFGLDYFTFNAIDAKGRTALGRVYINIITNADCAGYRCIDITTPDSETDFHIHWSIPPGECWLLPPPFNTVTSDQAGNPIDPPGHVCNPPYALLWTRFVISTPGGTATYCITNPCDITVVDCGTNSPNITNAAASITPTSFGGAKLIVSGNKYTWGYDGSTNSVTAAGPNTSTYYYCNTNSGKTLVLKGLISYTHDPLSSGVQRCYFRLSSPSATNLFDFTTTDVTNQAFTVTTPLADLSVNTINFSLGFTNDIESLTPFVKGKMTFNLSVTNIVQ